MKRILLFALALLTVTGAVSAQNSKQMAKDARKQAKAYAKEGWKELPGDLPMERQLYRSYEMQNETDAQGFPKWMRGTANSTGEHYDAANNSALNLAKLNLAEQLQTEMASAVKMALDNQQLQAGQAASLAKTISRSQTVMSRKFGRVNPVVRLFRTLPNKNVEVLVMVFYSSDQAMEDAKSVIREELAKEGEELDAQLDQIMGR